MWGANDAVLVTGGSSGLGLAVVRHLLAATPGPRCVVLTSRSRERAEAAAAALADPRCVGLPLRQGSAAGVDAFVAPLRDALAARRGSADAASPPRLAAVVANAGVFTCRRTKGGACEDSDDDGGSFLVNGLGPARLLSALSPLLGARDADARPAVVVSVASFTHRAVRRRDVAALASSPSLVNASRALPPSPAVLYAISKHVGASLVASRCAAPPAAEQPDTLLSNGSDAASLSRISLRFADPGLVMRTQLCRQWPPGLRAVATRAGEALRLSPPPSRAAGAVMAALAWRDDRLDCGGGEAGAQALPPYFFGPAGARLAMSPLMRDARVASSLAEAAAAWERGGQ